MLFLEIPDGVVIGTWCFHCHGLGFIPSLGTKTLQPCSVVQKKVI